MLPPSQQCVTLPLLRTLPPQQHQSAADCRFLHKPSGLEQLLWLAGIAFQRGSHGVRCTHRATPPLLPRITPAAAPPSAPLISGRALCAGLRAE
jgi:hypothetical protein